ncbi:MAG: protein translocase subunit SecF [Actinomycetota bacterium]|nr:protein translocase subunit SecF [Actinomycetota bacterium]
MAKEKSYAVNRDKSYKFDFVGKRKIWFIVSSVIILAGIIMFSIRGFNYGIDFLGGNLMEVKFKNEVPIAELRKAMEEIGYGKSILQSTALDQYIIRTVPITVQEKTRILDNLDEKIGIERPIIQDRDVAAGFSKQITKYALIAVAISIAGILIYIWIRFEVRFAIVSIFELLHDLLIVLGFYAITYREFNTTTIAVILTILGYSLSDTIIIFDRVREELRISKKEKFSDLVNYSINKTLVRSIGTAVTTLFPIILLLIVGNETLKDFAFGLFIGIISGSYSSVFIGSPLLVVWNNRFQKYKK